MKKLAKLGIVAGGFAVSLAALSPLTSYAATSSPTVTVTVNPVISIETTANAAITNVSSAAVGTGAFSVKVITNKGYTINLQATTTNAALTSTTTNDTIPAASTVTAGTNGWSIKTKTNNTTDGGYLKPLTTPQQYFESASGTVAAGVTTSFTVDVGVNSTLTAADYTTTLTATAANS